LAGELQQRFKWVEHFHVQLLVGHHTAGGITPMANLAMELHPQLLFQAQFNFRKRLKAKP
jgi:hypothetical protein